MLLDEVILVLPDWNIQTLIRNQHSLVKGILVRVPKSHELIVLLKVRERQLRHPAHRLQRYLTSQLELLHQRPELLFFRNLVKPAHAHIDRMDLSSADERHDGIARLLHLQSAFDEIGIILRHAYRVGIAEKVRRVQHVDVQGMALDPFAAVEQPAQGAQLSLNGYAEGMLHRVYGAHLVSDRADAADTRGDIGSLAIRTTAQERFEETRRLKYPEFDIGHLVAAHLHVERAFTLDARQVIHLYRSIVHVLYSPLTLSAALLNGPAEALKLRKTWMMSC